MTTPASRAADGAPEDLAAGAAAGADVLDAARRLAPEAIALRRALHRGPETALDLPATQRLILDALDGLGLDIRTGRALSSVTATLTGAADGPTILLRSDMDALPVTEDTGLPFASRGPGLMHACGHDVHMAMLVGAARLLAGRRATLPGRVVFMFQPGEEGHHGARLMIEEGVLEASGSRADAAFALHVNPNMPAGEVLLRPGPQMAASDRFRIVVRGRGGHASAPHTTCDPVPVACEIVLALQSAVTRGVAADDSAVLSVTRLTAGTATGVIPDTAELSGTLRTLAEPTRRRLHEAIARVAHGVAAAHGATAEPTVVTGYPVSVNDPGMTALVRRAAAGALGAGAVRELPAPQMTAEDFSYVLRAVPGAMAFLGACPPGVAPHEAPSLHSPRMTVDEDVIATGIACEAAVALAFLAGGGRLDG
ncbi:MULTISPECIES: M20 metallopeptidase family protein [Streptomyces]|uniref:M20 metallopeptidase family protein n=1 Tax=Streptomyces TaxID=1883 RepID=UPI0016763998|nr:MULTISPECIES: M20 family metallopeptidase [Streptomyces]MBK3521395.1 amidohydrolase [Streptomyces sp. MBT70]GGS01911.1 hippurate hydrolase [Streptomyces eurythermus]